MRILQKRGRKVKALENKPEPYYDLIPVWEVFNTLHRCRSVGFDVNPISVNDALNLLKMKGFTGEALDEAFELIMILDDYWLNEHREAVKRKKKR